MKTPIVLLILFFMNASEYTIDFGAPCNTCDWFVVVDGVMGGLSKGKIIETPDSVVFKGEISLENNGGFASYRSQYGNYDLSSYKDIVIRYKSTGQNFAFTLNNYRRFYNPNFKQELAVTNGVWKEVALPLSSFKKYRLGNLLPGYPSQKELANVIRMGFISNDKKASEFMIEIDYIRFK